MLDKAKDTLSYAYQFIYMLFQFGLLSTGEY